MNAELVRNVLADVATHMAGKYTHMTAREILRAYTPTFCFQTCQELLTMCEQVDESIQILDVHKAVEFLYKNGTLTRRPSNGYECRKRDTHPFEYMRIG